ncbi:formate dehydrogenase accessory sulfurtransferase FdhD [Deinococcus aquiradiocola]|uniref:Sulfur carrier protein FdhD n=1 Tax=Deinococcus aquiradiocola TaxID=393059 RepID=A0A917UKF7_9DEIO|nr:formate dehydrogenase accessory sulfurtransferase FdhD [Deinococcus aquiradiocola]GGJ63741.1 sulfurtransferase FdhD [Deinococcus aquiradiocola]
MTPLPPRPDDTSPAGELLARLPVRRYAYGAWSDPEPDDVAVEEPLELRLPDAGTDADEGAGGPGTPLNVTMRTPGHDLPLVHGWLHAEGLRGAVTRVWPDPDAPNVMWVSGDRDVLLAARRGTTTTSACGICGSGSVERLMLRAAPPRWTVPPLAPDLIAALPERLRAAQPAFQASGGLHAAGLFTPDGILLDAFEDVGRHNAVDKLVGAASLRGDLPLTDRVLVTSSRAGFEIVQKALLAGVAVVVTVGAPSSLAVDTAVSLGLTLVGFVRQGRLNVYAGSERLHT